MCYVDCPHIVDYFVADWNVKIWRAFLFLICFCELVVIRRNKHLIMARLLAETSLIALFNYFGPTKHTNLRNID
jgi:hypothetical protein